MSDLEINKVLARTRIQRVQANQAPPPVETGAPTLRESFSGMLKPSIDGVVKSQDESGNFYKAFEAGDSNVDLTQVMIAMQKAGVSFKVMTEVRNELVDAYKEIMNMPV